ncbi:carbon-monoxide dehydrogenase large subunit [Mycobacterium sp. OAS707]|uniref:xanthine dehydrogenase family protein molybdopterin-binding subunit n=1 Tax=Mycobacterium sp. OAS707 TaxID=2663822 RepID=UPI00178A2FA0|nr:xanthine dehydrogenase family protein molybdopterin-binding subunit [Mycobacterium sp. OAS707]MBE1547120.1 carbon-monoxide dehydrogenase large subunit [Mycobacterium sp. OAS707]
MTAGRFMGQAVARSEDPRLLAGRGRYIADVVVPGASDAAFLRSEVARGRIVSLDVEAARSAPGVRAVYTAADLNPLVHETAVAGLPEGPFPPKYCLAENDVRFVGDPIAIVIAENRYLAEDAVELIDIDIEPQEPVLDVDAARNGNGALVHPEIGTNTPQVIPLFGDPDLAQAFADAAHMVKDTIVMHRYVQAPMECRGIIADCDPYSDELTVWSGTQSVYGVQSMIAGLLGIGTNQIRVVQPDVGGGFGQKMAIMRDEWAVVLAAKLLGRPVRWIEDRRENLTAAAHARDERMDLSIAVDSDGNITAIQGEYIENIGAYQTMGSSGMGAFIAPFLTNAYKIPKIGFASQTVYTNTCGKAPYRGPFLMYAVGIEQLMDTAARQLGVDPLELRRRNVIRADDLPYTLPSMLCFESITPAETLEQAASMIDYDGFRAEQQAALEQGRYLGIGISLCVEPSGIAVGSMATEAAEIRMDYTGKVTAAVGSSSTGMSVVTTMKQVVAEHLGCAPEDVNVIQGDTAATPWGAGTGGSRSAVLIGNAVAAASTELRTKLLEIAADALEASVEDLEIDNSRVFVRGTATKGMSFADVGQMAYHNPDMLGPGTTPGLEASHRFKAPPFTFSNACHICTCEVDVDTGRVSILRYVVSEDCGRMINPKVVEGQVFGGVVQGIGGVLYEHMVYDDDGNPLTSTFVDYLLPTACEVPTIEVGHIESPAPNPLGVKGMGEGGAIASPAAVINAVADALAPLGVRISGSPLGPRQILDMIAAAGR